ncbi:hypothetical protein AALK46_13035 [Staphylococcus nepalensis]|uniref:hypothetical protein n=1 Tax=Staphylococcus TaxID=1279 RepID=UPI002DBC698E|nr:hypothetical protein [Staphylococcus pseudoxylosus]MEB6038044.1 hypothetical protein [Staphylococcus pseudoxylosus]
MFISMKDSEPVISVEDALKVVKKMEKDDEPTEFTTADEAIDYIEKNNIKSDFVNVKGVPFYLSSKLKIKEEYLY